MRLTLVFTTLVVACATNPWWVIRQQSIQEVDGTVYFMVSGTVPNTELPSFTRRWAWSVAEQALVDSLLSTVRKRCRVNGVGGRVYLMEVHELGVHETRDSTTVVLGIPLERWEWLVAKHAAASNPNCERR